MPIKLTDLPEEVLANIISLALPPEASILRVGKVICPITPLLLICKRLSGTTQSVYFNTQFNIYTTHLEDKCASNYLIPNFGNARERLSDIPWTQFKYIRVHVYPEISFLALEHGSRHPETLDVRRQMRNEFLLWDDLPARSNWFSRQLQDLGLPRQLANGKTDITLEFHSSCPFHDPYSYEDPENPPFYHIPIWDLPGVLHILNQFGWLLGTAPSISDLRRIIKYPHIVGWTSSDTDLSGQSLGQDFISDMVLLHHGTPWEQPRDFSTAEIAEVEQRSLVNPMPGITLRQWIAQFDTGIPYNISPAGTISRMGVPDKERGIRLFNTCRERLDQYMLHGRSHWVFKCKWFRHELDVLDSRMTLLQDRVWDPDSLWNATTHELRMRVFEPILTACLREIDLFVAQQPSIDDEKAVASQTTRKIDSHLQRLRAFGQWNGYWSVMESAEHYLVSHDEDTLYGWCKCGRRLRR